MASDSYSYVLTEVAESDIDEALAYIAVHLKNQMQLLHYLMSLLSRLKRFVWHRNRGNW